MAGFEPPESTFQPEPEYPPDGGDAGGAPGGAASSEERTMGMLCHLLAIFTWFIGPLVVWLIKKDTSAFVDDQGKEAVNFQITISILYVVGVLLAFITCGVGIFLPAAVGVLNLVFCIIATVAASNGERYRYPFAIRLIR